MIMNKLSDYKQKTTTAECAVELVHSGDRVWVQQGCGVPVPLLDALVERAAELRDVEMCHMLTLSTLAYTRLEFTGHFRHNGLFLGGNVREAVSEGRADYTPICLSEIEGLFEHQLPIDVAFIQVCPPDEHGFVSLGVGADCTLTAARRARIVVAEVNDRMPRALGDAFLHLNQITALVPTCRPLVEFQQAPATEAHGRIADQVAALIPDGATLQMGIGGIPNAVLARLASHQNLGVHSEMCP
jgi:4-hydroxybutyrate CoA-transferase